jgi:cytochrome c-type biogenesis protein CcmE
MTTSQQASPSPKPRKRAVSTKWLIGIAVIAAAVITVAMTQINSNVVYFYTPEEAHTQAFSLSAKIIKVGGMVTPGSIAWKAEDLDLAFVMSDLKGHDITVRYTGAPPDMFKEGQGVVVEGKLSQDGKQMTARKLLVKHSEEYKKPGDHAQSQNKELLERSIIRDSN